MHFGGAEEQVDLGQRFDELRFVAFDHAADGDDGLTPSDALESRRFDHRVYRFFLGGVDEAAGVDDDEVGVIELRRMLGGVVGQLREIALAIDRVLVATERDDSNFHGVARMERSIEKCPLNDNSRI